MNHHKIFLSVFLFVIFLSCAPSTLSAAIIGRPANNLGLVGYWSFNEGAGTFAGDFSGNGKTGAVDDATWITGKRGSALSFSGSDTSVDIGSLGVTTEYTASAWIKPSNLTGSGETSTYGFSVMGASTAAGQFPLWVAVNGSEVRFWSYETTAGVGGYRETTGAGLVVGQWYHIVVTAVDAGTSKVYVNGVERLSFTNDSDVDWSNIFTIGDLRPNRAIEFEGVIDEVKVYNRALSVTEVIALYNVGVVRANTSQTSVTNGLVARWTFDGADVTDKIYDRIGGSDGYVHGGATSTILGKVGQAMNFPGLNNMVSIAASANIPAVEAPQSISMWYWANSNTAGDTQDIINLRTTIAGSGNGIGITGAAVLRIVKWGGTIMHSISAPAARQWHHVVWTSDGSNGVMYVDGVQVDADAIAPQTGTVGLIYLSTYDQADNDFIGKLDDVRIYNRAITAAEVTRIYDESAGTRLNANTSSGSLNSGLISYWSFNGTDITSDLVRDSSGLNNHGGFIGGSTSTAKVIGKIGQALRFDGVNDHVVTVMGNSIKGLSQASISAWFKADALTGATQILYEEAINASTNSRFSLRIHTTNRIRFFGRAPDAAGGTTWVDSTTDLVPGEWYHVVGIFNADSDIQTIVLNGVAQTASVSEDAFDATDPNQIPRIGSRPGSEPFRGIIDEVRLYNRALSVEEAKRLYNIGR